MSSLIFFFNDTATTEIYTLSLHDALPICHCSVASPGGSMTRTPMVIFAIHFDMASEMKEPEDRKSTRLNSSHSQISYAVFCLKKKNRQHDRVSAGISPAAPIALAV